MPQMEGTAICLFAILLRQSAPFPLEAQFAGGVFLQGENSGFQGYLFLQPVHAGKDLLGPRLISRTSQHKKSIACLIKG